VNPVVARIRFDLAVSYYRRVVTQAAREATHPWASRLGVSAALAVLTFIFSWLLTGRDALTGLAVAACTLGGWWLLVVSWFLLTIPPRIENDLQRKEETLRVLSERRHLANELRNHMVACRTGAQEARAVAIEDGHRGMTPDTFHQRALLAAQDAEGRLERFGKQTGQVSEESHILEIIGAVSTKKCATFEEAIAQLEALADVFERQLASGFYW
jgi:hypothetical protein